MPDQPSRYVAFESLSPSVAAQVEDFVLESNRIEGISVLRAHELEAHTRFLGQREITVADMCTLVKELAGASLRSSAGMDVRVGPHLPPPGGPKIEHALKRILLTASTLGRPPYEVHCEYESLHPFMDGNGRSGRALWAWMMLKDDRDPFALPFLQRWYYESLNAGRVRL